MPELRFDNRVAVITGAGRGLGRAYALLLASRGARIVVNDVGASLKGEGIDIDPAQSVVNEIKSAGGDAIVSTDSVATPAGGKHIIQSALDRYGRIDILIHNAGIVRRGSLEELSYEDFELVLDVHLRGGFHVVRPAFPIMSRAGYGRVVMTSSINGIYGNANVVNYSVAKAGLIGLSNVVALEGATKGIKSNVIMPAAVTRMSEGVDTSAFPPMDPEMVAPAVAYLAHESCAVSGEILVSAAGRVARAFPAESRGIYRRHWTIEDVAADLQAIRDPSTPVVFPVVPSGHLDHLRYSFAMTKQHAQ
jgi:NAD(P)-dependent dehydrogenase (short-subunit alcohol dehydrogenase family)